MAPQPEKGDLSPSPLERWLKALGDNTTLSVSRIGAKAYALRALAKKTGTEVIDAAIAKTMGTSPQALQHADHAFDAQKPKIYALLKLAQVAGLLDEMDSEARRQSRTGWLKLFPLFIKDGFYPWPPPTGYRRPTPGEMTGQATRKIRVSPELAAKIAEDPALEKMLRRFQLRRDGEMADKLRETILLIHEGWLPLRAARESKLSVKKTTFLALLPNPILYGKISYKGQLYDAKVDKPIISKEEGDLLKRRFPLRGGKNLFGFIWDNKKRVQDPREVWMIKIVYEMRLQKLSNPQISELTGMSLELVRSLFYVESYRELVGTETWGKARKVRLFPEATRRAEEGKRTRLRILQAMWKLREQGKAIFPKSLATELQLRPDAIAKHLKIMEEKSGMIKRLQGKLGYEPLMKSISGPSEPEQSPEERESSRKEDRPS